MCSRGRPLSGAAHPPVKFSGPASAATKSDAQGACQAGRAGNKALRRGALEVCPEMVKTSYR